MFRLMIAVLLCVSSLGCKFGRLTNRYLDKVDWRNDRSAVYLDHLYSPCTDLTRAGKQDWCRTSPACIAKRTCKTLEGARDVPEPSFVIYPQPPEMTLESVYGSSTTEEAEAELDSYLPPSPDQP